MKPYDFIIVGAGIFGITTAVELAKRKYRVCILNPDRIPHHLAASTDITKAVRMEYGSDAYYFELVKSCIPKWREWNQYFQAPLYNEVGFLMLCRNHLDSKFQQFELASYEMLQKYGFNPEILDNQSIQQEYPVLNASYYPEAVFNPIGGFANASLVVQKLVEHATSLGVDVKENQTVSSFKLENNRISGVQTYEGHTFTSGHVIVAAGVMTSKLVPALQAQLTSTAHPVFWLKPESSKPLSNLPVFAADISNTGWYGFPWTSEQGVFKIAKHAEGEKLNPTTSDRRVKDEEVLDMRLFLNMSFPTIDSAPLIYTRKCLYTDTVDGHFLIDNHPNIDGLTIATGGSGHGFKFAPILGEIVADVAESKSSVSYRRFRWRSMDKKTNQDEEARFIANRKKDKN